MKKVAVILLTIALLVPCAGMWVMHNWYENRLAELDRAAFIIADKETMLLKVYNLDGECIADFPMACGKALGNKQAEGDNKTPEGIFRISDIQNSAEWKHDFGDGNGEITGAYGRWFIRLDTPPHRGIGIHGTHLPASIGKRDTEGCIRLSNKDIDSLKNMVYCGLNVIILPSKKDIIEHSTTE